MHVGKDLSEGYEIEQYENGAYLLFVSKKKKYSQRPVSGKERHFVVIFAILMVIFGKYELVDSVICEYSGRKTRAFASVFKSPAVHTLTL